MAYINLFCWRKILTAKKIPRIFSFKNFLKNLWKVLQNIEISIPISEHIKIEFNQKTPENWELASLLNMNKNYLQRFCTRWCSPRRTRRRNRLYRCTWTSRSRPAGTRPRSCTGCAGKWAGCSRRERSDRSPRWSRCPPSRACCGRC